MNWLFILLIMGFTNTEPYPSASWGFHSHKMINRLAVFTLPPSMVSFYKYHIHDITQGAVRADQRRYAIKEEAPRHYIDLDYYGPGVPEQWQDVQELYLSDSLQAHGILPWHLRLIKFKLTKAMVSQDAGAIISLSADAGHYIADAHVPLHTTSNYNGQKSGQHGIHGFWETRIPELLWDSFDLWVGKARYRNNYYCDLWDVLWNSYSGVDSVLNIEKRLTITFSPDSKFGYEQRNQQVVKVYSRRFSRAYHRQLNRQVEHKVRDAIKFIGDFWYTCWIDAGQPNLHQLTKPLHGIELGKMDEFWQYGHISRDSITLK